MAERVSPPLRRKRLAAHLLSLREQKGLKADQVADDLGWSASKMVWIERNRGKKPSVGDVRLLCQTYETDDTTREYLEQLARDGRQRGWWDSYADYISGPLENLVGLEAEASTMLNFEIGMVPGLLQTEDYARSMIEVGPAELDANKVSQRVEVRMRRQEVLRGDPPLRLVAIMDEAALHREVGGPDVMRAQLRHLLEIIEELPRLTVQVIPFSKGAHPSMTNGFAIYQFPDQDDADVVYVENSSGSLWLEKDDEVRDHHVGFQHLLGTAASSRDTIALIRRMAKT